jgi:uncharacterized integral membrane protein
MAGESGNKRAMTDNLRLVGALVLLVLLVAFIVGNSQNVEVSFIFFKTSISLIWALLIAVILGLGIDRLIIAMMKHRKNKS